MKELLAFIVENLVENPKDVKVSQSSGYNEEVILELKVNPEDMGLVIGKGGKVIKSIRNIIRTKAILDQKKVNLVLLDQ